MCVGKKCTPLLSLLFLLSGQSYNWRPKYINSRTSSVKIQCRNNYSWQRSRLKISWHHYSSVNIKPTLLSLQRGTLSLDRTMIPKSPSLLNKIIDNMSGLQGLILYAFSAMIVTLVLQLLSSLFRSLFTGSNNNDQSTATSFMESISKYFMSTALTIQNVFSSSSSEGTLKEKPLDLNKWNVCKVSDRQSLNSEYTKYTMELPASMSSNIKLALGQEVFSIISYRIHALNLNKSLPLAAALRGGCSQPSAERGVLSSSLRLRQLWYRGPQPSVRGRHSLQTCQVQCSPTTIAPCRWTGSESWSTQTHLSGPWNGHREHRHGGVRPRHCPRPAAPQTATIWASFTGNWNIWLYSNTKATHSNSLFYNSLYM